MKNDRIRTVIPGKAGTKSLLEQYGSDLVCVRYRYSVKTKQVTKTAELVIDRKPWNPDKKSRIPGHKTLKLRVRYGEIHLGRLVRQAGGVWDREEGVWRLRYDEIKSLGLTDRVIWE